MCAPFLQLAETLTLYRILERLRAEEVADIAERMTSAALSVIVGPVHIIPTLGDHGSGPDAAH